MLPQSIATPFGDAFHLVKARIQSVQKAMKEVMVKDIHYGVIPGTDKPALLKPGAEMICAMFQLAPSLVPSHISDFPDITRAWKARKKKWFEGPKGKEFTWEVIEGETQGYYEVLCTATLTSLDGRVVATASGSCNNLENKYRDMSVWDELPAFSFYYAGQSCRLR